MGPTHTARPWKIIYKHDLGQGEGGGGSELLPCRHFRANSIPRVSCMGPQSTRHACLIPPSDLVDRNCRRFC